MIKRHDLRFEEHELVKTHCDSQSGIHLTNQQMYHERTKLIDICLHFIRDMIGRENCG